MEIEDCLNYAEEWLRGFMECSPLFEYETTEEEKKRAVKSFREFMQERIDLYIINEGIGELTYNTADC